VIIGNPFLQLFFNLKTNVDFDESVVVVVVVEDDCVKDVMFRLLEHQFLSFYFLVVD
jgi:uncharacterized protein YbcI